jgi:hypothetical protein
MHRGHANLLGICAAEVNINGTTFLKDSRRKQTRNDHYRKILGFKLTDINYRVILSSNTAGLK